MPGFSHLSFLDSTTKVISDFTSVILSPFNYIIIIIFFNPEKYALES